MNNKQALEQLNNMSFCAPGDGRSLLGKKLFELIPAMLLANLSTFVILQVDAVVVGNLVSEKALAAVSLFQPMCFFIGAIAAFISGSQFLISGAIGKNDGYRQKAAIKSSMIVAAMAMAIVMILEVPLTHILISGYEEQELIHEYAVPYYLTNIIGCVSVWGTHMFVSYGKTKLLFIMSLVESSVNAVLDLFFVGVLDMGVSGAATGTLLANVARVVLTIWFISKMIDIKEIIRLKIKKNELKQNIIDIVRYSIPLVSSSIMISVQSFIMNGLFIDYYGTDGIIILTVNKFILGLATLCFGAVVSAGSGITGILRGASEYERYRQCIKMLKKIIVCMGAFFTIIAIVGYRMFFRICGIEDVPEIAFVATILFSIVYIPRGINAVTRVYFTYENKTKIMSGLIILQMAVLPLVFGLTICKLMNILIFAAFAFADLVVFAISTVYVMKMNRKQIKEEEHQIRLMISVGEENAVQASTYAIDCLRAQGLDERTVFQAGLCIEEMLTYLPEKKGRKTEIMLLIYVEKDDLVFHMIHDGRDLHLDTLDSTPVYDIIYDNYELIHAIADDFAYQHVMNLSNITVRFNMNNERMKLSVIIPTYNYIDNLYDGVHSVIDQMSPECECVIVDDGSDPSFVEELKKMEQSEAFRNRNVIVEYADHKGPSEARNRGIALAKGEYIAFLDGDDQMVPGIIGKALEMLEEDADMYIFSIEAVRRVGGKPEIEKWELADRRYESAAEFADEYVRNRHLLLYSQCNKLYRKKIINKEGLGFDRGVTFGEDRLFNYEYLRYSRRIITSETVMFRYNIREENPTGQAMSLSKKHIVDYFDTAMELHEKKMQCILSLARGISESERHEFEQYDLRREIEKTISRFEMHPEEKDQCIDKINEIVFGKEREIPVTADAVVVLGSRRCRYRIERAFELFGRQAGTMFIVCGGNPYDDTDMTEADFMAGYLQEQGVDASRIIIENKSVNTETNLKNAEQLIDKEKKEIRTVAIVTAGFHIVRTELIAEKNNCFAEKTVYYIPAFGSNTGKDNWFENPQGKELVLHEIENR